MERTGEVTAVTGQWLEVTFCRPADCEKCQACRGGQKTVAIRVKGTAKVGDSAVVQMSMRTIAKASAIAYALPVAGLFAGLALGEWLLPTENSLGGILGGAVGLLAALLAIRMTEKKRQSDPQWDATLLRVIPREGQ